MSKNSSGDALPLPPELPQSTVSEIASWLVGLPLDAVERELICQTLEACGGDRAAAASVLGISLPALRKKITAYAVRGQPIPGTETNANKKPRAKDASEPQQEGEALPPAEEAAAETPALPELPVTADEIFEAAPLEVPEIPEAAEAPAEEFTRLAAGLLEAARAERGVHVREEIQISLDVSVSAEIVSFPLPAKRDVLDPRGIDAPKPDDFAFAEAVAARAVMPEPLLTVPEAANDMEQAVATGPLERAAPRRRFNMRLLAAAGVIALTIAPIAYGLLKEAPKNAAPASLDRVQLQVSVREQPLQQPLEQRIPVPAWVMPPERATPPAAAQPAEPEPAAPAPVAPAPAIPAPIVAEPEAPAVFAPNTSGDVAMELAPVNSGVDVAMPLTPPNTERDVAMALTPPNSQQDIAMPLAPPNAERDVAMALGSVDIAADTRMEPGDWQASLARAGEVEEATGSIPVATFFKAPERAPMPRERLDPDEQPRRAAVRPRAPEPQAETPAIEPFFLFNIFAPREGRRGLIGGGVPAQGGAN